MFLITPSIENEKKYGVIKTGGKDHGNSGD
jgi:hypothetical protein